MGKESNKLVKGNGMSFRTEDVIEARYQLSSRGNDILDIVLSKLEMDDNTRYIIDVSDYRKYYDESVQNTYKRFKATVDEMREKGIEIRNKEKNEYIYYPWFSKIHYINDEGMIEVDLHKELKKILLEVKRKIFFNLKYSTKLKSEYAKRLYYYARFYADTGWRIDKVEELADKLECPKSYKTRYNAFKTKVLEIAKEQINKYSDIEIKYEEIKKGKKVVSIKMIIKKKDIEDLKEIKKHNDMEKVEVNRIGLLRIDIENCINRYKKDGVEITTDIKKDIANEFGISERSLARYIHINNNLIDEIKEMYDKKFISLREIDGISNKSIDEQQKELRRIYKNIKRSRVSLIPELQEKLDVYDISYHQMIKYSKMSIDKQVESYKKKFSKEKVLKKSKSEIENEVAITSNNELIDVNYKEIEKNYIEEIRDRLVGIKLSDEEINDIYISSAKDIDYIEYIYKEMNNQDKEIRNVYKWLKAMVVPGKYKEPISVSKKKNYKFFNFKEREYDYDALEEQLLASNSTENESEIINSDYEEDFIKKLIKDENENKEDYDDELSIIKLQLSDILQEKYGEVKYMTWLKEGVDNLKISKNKAIFLVRNRVAYDIVENNYLSYIAEMIKIMNTEIEIVELQLKN